MQMCLQYMVAQERSTDVQNSSCQEGKYLQNFFYGLANLSRNEVFTLQVMKLKRGCPPTVKQTVCLGAADVGTICMFSFSSVQTLELARACDV